MEGGGGQRRSAPASVGIAYYLLSGEWMRRKEREFTDRIVGVVVERVEWLVMDFKDELCKTVTLSVRDGCLRSWLREPNCC